MHGVRDFLCRLKMGSIDSDDSASFCPCCQVLTVTLETMQPISNDIECSHHCREVRMVPKICHLPNEPSTITVS